MVVDVLKDKALICRDCGIEFVFTVGEQEFYIKKGLENEPQRCSNCRIAKKNYMFKQEQFITICAECGGEAKIRFTPQEGRPVYCDECFYNNKESSKENIKAYNMSLSMQIYNDLNNQ